MKSFFEFYQKLKTINEQDTMVPPNLGLNAAAPGGMMPPPAGGPQMGGVPGAPPAPMQQQTGFDMGSEMSSLNQDAATAPEEGDRSQLSPPEGEVNVDSAFQALDSVRKFLKDFQVDDSDDDKERSLGSLKDMIDAAIQQMSEITGVQPPESTEDEGDASVGSNQIATTPDQLEPGTETPYGATDASVPGMGNNFPSNGSGSGDMGGNMDGGSSPATTGPGSLGFGGAFAG
jgi:hypothetical protein